MMFNKYVLSGSKAVFAFEPADKVIRGADIEDQANLPRCYSETKRGIEKAWQALLEAWNEDMTMYGAMKVLEAHKIRMHDYYAWD